MKSFEVVKADTIEELKSNLESLSKKLYEETKNAKFIKEIESVSFTYTVPKIQYEAIVTIDSRFNKNYVESEESKSQEKLQEKKPYTKEKKPFNKNKGKDKDIVSEFFKNAETNPSDKERMRQKQSRGKKFNR